MHLEDKASSPMHERLIGIVPMPRRSAVRPIMGLYCIASLLLAVYPERAYETRSSLIGELKDAILVGTRAARAESGFGYETRQPESGAPSAKNHVVRHLRAFPSRISPSGATALGFPVGSGRRITTTDTSQMSSAHPANASEPELSEPSANLPPTSSRSHKEAPTSEWQPKEEHNQAREWVRANEIRISGGWQSPLMTPANSQMLSAGLTQRKLAGPNPRPKPPRRHLSAPGALLQTPAAPGPCGPLRTTLCTQSAPGRPPKNQAQLPLFVRPHSPPEPAAYRVRPQVTSEQITQLVRLLDEVASMHYRTHGDGFWRTIARNGGPILGALLYLQRTTEGRFEPWMKAPQFGLARGRGVSPRELEAIVLRAASARQKNESSRVPPAP